MSRKRRVIIDTDPGVDDILAMLLALSSDHEELEVELISITYGNVDVQNCLRNVVSMFHHIDKEMAWRRVNGRPESFETLKRKRPIVAVGPEKPLTDQILMADFFHGIDGLGGIHETHPHLTPEETWKDLFTSAFTSGDTEEAEAAREIQTAHALFSPSRKPGHEEILNVLRSNEPDTITVVAIGPLTNLAIAAAADPEAFLRAKEVVVMGGALGVEGNITPVAEFNVYADSIAAARVFALTSPNPQSTMPPMAPTPPGTHRAEPHPLFLAPYPEKLSRRLKLTLFPLDITTPHLLTRTEFNCHTQPFLSTSPPSPLAEWTTAFLTSTFRKMESLYDAAPGTDVGLQLHDPLTVWHLITSSHAVHPLALTISDDRDIRVETSGQWTRGMCVVDRRNRKKLPPEVRSEGENWLDVDRTLEENEKRNGPGEEPVAIIGDGNETTESSDHGHWLGATDGNRVRVALRSPGVDAFGQEMLKRIFGV